MDNLRLTIPAYPVGAPCWVDLLVADPAAAQDFYTALFGWSWRPGDEQTGGYPLALLHGAPVAGLSRRPEGAPVPSQWTTYLRTGDVYAAGRAIAQHGGRPLGRPATMGRLARSLIATGPGGAYFGVWEPGWLPGSGVLDEAGSLTWNELATRDYDAVQTFYRAVFDLRFTDASEEGGPRWATAATSDGNPAFGLSEVGPEWPDDIPSHWIASFATEAIVETVATALGLGAALLNGPFEGPYGLGAVLRGPEGEVFSVLEPHEED
ncbi:glyoxalase/bleomycin resistance protein/dioxygenase [Intrasporangium chromatireducens Q5-1]|uniref:Glyoxalase/bleomycin resistance protein/dioxygenase n=1 Tax=Intrasporangium chromatireducens Q5-1 TaxID=584657 RepID=W9GUI8_9MICO|nr:VOC family protein [Intrasporangium chromatireducens]EWT07509.1 glyoxalase/bleomycin resistance protein/dioxygenase [Intrasporangium chromatireducens Q5-1]